jgi:Senescence-associated protein
MEETLQAEVLLLMPNTKLYEIIEENKRMITKGDLKILRIGGESVYLMIVENFSYSLSKDLSVMRSKRDQYVFPMLNGFLGIVLDESTSHELLKTFELILSDITDFTLAKYRYSVEENKKQQTMDLESAQVAKKSLKLRKLSMLIESGGESIKRGIIRAATFTSKGIKKGEEYLKTKIKPKSKPLVVSEKQSAAIENLKTVSNAALVLSKAVVLGAANTTKEIGKWVSSRFKKTDASKKLERTEAYHIAKDIGKAGLSAAITIYDGLEEALTILAKSGSEATVDIVNHTYGEEAKKAAEESIQALANLGNAYKGVTKVGIKQLTKATAKNAAENIFSGEKTQIS